MSGLRYIDVCSGISAPTMAWKPLGWQALCFAEIEAAPRAVLAHHYPQVPLRGDFTEIEGTEYGPVDLLVGGTPCQSFSIAGLRGGLDDDRGNLALQFARLASRARPRWVVWENVPGVLSSNGGRDFGAILGALAELGYGLAYRVLDAQHFGVPQRRRRVFVVGYLGDWRRAAAVLLERHSLQGHSAPRREAGEGPAVCPTLRAGGNRTGGDRPPGTDVDTCESLIAWQATGDAFWREGVGPLSASDDNGSNQIVHSFRGEGFDASEDGTGRGTPLVPVAIQERAVSENIEAGPQGKGWQEDCAYTLEARNKVQSVAFNITPSNSNKDFNARESERAQALTAGGNRPSARGGDLVCFSAEDHGADAMHDLSPTLRAGGHSGSHANAGVMPAVAFDMRGREGGAQFEGPHDSANLRAASGGSSRSYEAASAVRRLTPRECERLQGFPDDFTLVPHRGKTMADGPRYKMLGNSMAVPVLRWIGERIEAVEAHCSASSERSAA